MKVLVTGASGFVGRYLIQGLINRNHTVFWGSRNKENGLGLLEYQVQLNIENEEEIEKSLKYVKPDAIIHLAAQSNVAHAWDNPAETFKVNTIGTINLINKVIQFNPNIKIITVGSSEEYGLTAKKYFSLDEEKECYPQNPYASSKLSAGQVALQMAMKHDLKLMHVRPFNHFGPGQKKGFVISDFASQVAEIEAGFRERKIFVGDISTWRDFTDVRDIVNAYILLLENNVENGVYNICSGVARNIEEILQQMITISTEDVKIVIDPLKFRPSEVKKFVGDSTKLKKKINWSTQYNFTQSLKETLEWWRSQVKN